MNSLIGDNAKTAALLLKKYENTTEPLTDSELTLLANGLEFMYHFNVTSDLGPLAVYYGMKREAIDRIITNRLNK
jgi:hypothetical protein